MSLAVSLTTRNRSGLREIIWRSGDSRRWRAYLGPTAQGKYHPTITTDQLGLPLPLLRTIALCLFERAGH